MLFKRDFKNTAHGLTTPSTITTERLGFLTWYNTTSSSF